MSRDRFNEFQQQSGVNPNSNSNSNSNHTIQMDSLGSSDEKHFMNIIDGLKDQIRALEQEITKTSSLYEQGLNTINDRDAQRVRSELEAQNSTIDASIAQIKNKIANLQYECSNPKLSRSQGAARMSRLQNISKLFRSLIGNYQETKQEYLVKNNMRLKRQYKLAKPSATDEEIEDAIHNNQAGNVFAQAILKSDRSQDANRVLKEVETRQKDIASLERTILELNALFEEITDMVNSQQEAIDSIELGVDDANVNVTQASENVAQAIVYRKKSRKRMWCLLFLLLILIAVIVIIIYFTVVKK